MKYRPEVLKRLQEQVLAELETTPNQGKYSFFTEEDSKRNQTRELVTAEVIDYTMLDAALSNINYPDKIKPLVAIDIETTRLEHWMDDSEILGIGFTIPQYNFTKYYQQHKFLYVVGDLSKAAEVIEKFNPFVRWCGHNLKFDMLWLLNHLGVMLDDVEDSMCLAYLLTCGTGQPLALDKLAQQHLNRYPYTLEEIIGKPKSQTTPEDRKNVPVQQMADYCCEDTYESFLLWHLFTRKMRLNEENQKLLELYEIDRKAIKCLVWMEDEGIRVDLSKLEDIMSDVTLEQEVITDEAKLYALGVDLNSPQQLSIYLYQELKLPTQGIKKGKTGFYSTDKESLSKNAGLHPLVDLLLEYRRLTKLNTSFLKPLPKLQRCNRIHPTFNNCRTVTGRLSCDNPNLQQIPNVTKSEIGKAIRKLYIASPGYAIIRADYSQMELRILAHLSQDPYLLDCYKRDLDVHIVVTEMVFDIKYDSSNPEHKKLRTLCKNLNFGLIYGMTAMRLLSYCIPLGLNKDMKWCERMLCKYWEIFTGVRDWMFGEAYVGTIERGYTSTLHGRRRYFEFKHPYLRAMKGTGMDYTYQNYKTLEKKGVLSDPYDLECLRAAGNAPVQGGNADACRIAAARLYEKFNPHFQIINSNYNLNSACRILLLVHDEVVAEAPIETAMQVRDEIVEIMEQSYPLSVPVKVSSSISDSWGSAD